MKKQNLFYYFNLFISMTTWSFYWCWNIFLNVKMLFLFSKNMSMQLKGIYYSFSLYGAEIFIIHIFSDMTICPRFNHLKFWKKSHYICSPPDTTILTVIIYFTLWLLLKVIVLYRMWVWRMISSWCQMCSVCHWLTSLVSSFFHAAVMIKCTI